MRTRRTGRSLKFGRFLGPPAFDWLHGRFLPAAGALYDELAKVGVVEHVNRRGKPAGRAKRSAPWSWGLQLVAAGERDDKGRSLVEVGAMVRAAQTGTTRRAILDAVTRLPTADERQEAKASLRKLGRRYVQQGRAQRRSDDEWPPKTLRSATDRRTDFQAMLLWVIARWVADQRPQPYRASARARAHHGMLMEILHEPHVAIPLTVWAK